MSWFNKRRYIHIDSNDRNTPNQNQTSNETGSFSINLVRNYGYVKKLKLEYINIPVLGYNVTSSNNTIYFSAPGGSPTYTVTIPSGAYNAYSLCTAIALAMNTAVGSSIFTVTYSPTTFLITIASSTPNYILTFGTNTTNSLAGTAGFINQNVTISGASVTATNTPLLAPLDFFLCIGDAAVDIGGNQKSEVGATFAIPINGNSGDYVNFVSTDQYGKLYKDVPLNNIMYVTVIDNNYNVLNLLNARWTACISYEETDMENEVRIN